MDFHHQLIVVIYLKNISTHSLSKTSFGDFLALASHRRTKALSSQNVRVHYLRELINSLQPVPLIMGSELGVTAASKPKPNVDSVGIWWACWCSIWTFAVMCGMAYLYSKRHLPLMRIRGLGLSLVAITLLHLYWISVQLGYIVGALAPGDAEYWIMGTYFPFGIALFHASNTRFLHVAKAQKKFASQKNAGLRPRGKGFVATFKRMDYTSKMIIVVGLGMLFQV